MLLLFFWVAAPLQLVHVGVGLLVAELGVCLWLPLGLAAYLKLDVRETFRLRSPPL
jgi:hypothetical protein